MIDGNLSKEVPPEEGIGQKVLHAFPSSPLDRIAAKRLGRDARGLGPGLWFDTVAAGLDVTRAIEARLLECGYTGLILSSDDFLEFSGPRFARLTRIVQIEDCANLAAFVDRAGDELLTIGAIVASGDSGVLDRANELGLGTCLRARIGSGTALSQAIEQGRRFGHVVLAFADPTNIPLELVIAEFQSSQTAVIKEITNPDCAEEAVAALSTMEVGADGVVISPRSAEAIDSILPLVSRALAPRISIRRARVESSRPIGMGHRACLDLVTLFDPTEGILVGSTSQGGILCCPEVFYLPYMEKRPFRVNAGGVHSYLFMPRNRTLYLSELRAGQSALVVSADGATREAPIGRVKIEVRPLRLIGCRFESGEELNIILQDDWHVRVFDGDGEPRSITELRPGDQISANLALPGRHVGIPIDEFIREN